MLHSNGLVVESFAATSVVMASGASQLMQQSSLISLSDFRPSRAQQISARAQCRARKTPQASLSSEVTLLDYGAGNVRSVRNALKKLGYTIKEVCACFTLLSHPHTYA